MPNRRLRVAVRRGRLYVDVEDLAVSYRARAQAYRRRAEELTAGIGDGLPVLDRVVPPLEEALACRMVAEELEQRADQLDAL